MKQFIKSIIKKNVLLYRCASNILSVIRKFNIKYRYFSTLKKDFKNKLGYDLDLKNPKSFNEKLQWLKCYYRDPIMPICADKVAVRDIVAQIIGKEYLVPIYGVFNSVEEIDISKLPNSFVLKPSHSSGRVIVCIDKEKMNWHENFKKLKKWLTENYYYQNGEWVYKHIQPRVICEKLLDNNINDYKFYCFNGEPKILLVCTDRENRVKMNYYDMDFNELDFSWSCEKSKLHLNKPQKLKSMINLAKKLSLPFPHVRVDFFCVNNNIFFSELTFFDANGFGKFYPVEWDYKLGDMLDLNNCKKDYIVIKSGAYL